MMQSLLGVAAGCMTLAAIALGYIILADKVSNTKLKGLNIFKTFSFNKLNDKLRTTVHTALYAILTNAVFTWVIFSECTNLDKPHIANIILAMANTTLAIVVFAIASACIRKRFNDYKKYVNGK